MNNYLTDFTLRRCEMYIEISEEFYKHFVPTGLHIVIIIRKIYDLRNISYLIHLMR